MEKNSTTRHVAIVEKCVMTEMAWRYIFSREDNRRYHIHLFKNVSMLRAAEIPFPWSTIIFSLSGSRSSRAESLLFVHEMARCRPEVQTIILANNESEMHLIGHLISPTAMRAGMRLMPTWKIFVNIRLAWWGICWRRKKRRQRRNSWRKAIRLWHRTKLIARRLQFCLLLLFLLTAHSKEIT